MNPRLRTVLLAGMSALLGLTALTPTAAQASVYDWPTYHHDNFRGGSDPSSVPFNGPLLVRTGDREHALGDEVASKIWVVVRAEAPPAAP